MAGILNEAWRLDGAWGTLVWIAMRTGARRGEICAMRWDRLDLDAGVLRIDTAVAQNGSRSWEKSTKTGRRRRVALGETDVELLRSYLKYRQDQAQQLGTVVRPDGRIFSPDPDHRSWLLPSTVSQRYARMCDRLGIDTSLKSLRHYSATELIASGVDVRTVAGRLGHAGGGVTTLKVYSAFVDEADQKAADLTSTRMPQAPAAARRMIAAEPEPAVPEEPHEPYERIAADLAAAMRCEALSPGATLPSLKKLASRYDVAPSTAFRALELLKHDGLVDVLPGKGTVVHDPAAAE